MAQLAPKFDELSIGVRSLRKVTIYPLSVADQIKIKMLVAELFSILENRPLAGVSLEGVSDDDEMVNLISAESLEDGADFISKIIDAIAENIEQVIGYVTEESDNVTLADMTNDQLVDLIGIIVEKNFETPGKKLIKVVQKVKGLFPSRT